MAQFDQLFGGPARKPEERVRQRDMDLAASIQQVTEEVVLRLTRALARETGQKNLCLAGGVALNCVANGKVLRDGQFERIWIQPAAGDAGGAIGAAWAAYHLFKGQPRQLDGVRDGMSGAYLGPAFEQAEIERRLGAAGAVFDVVTDDGMIADAVDSLVDGKAVGWFQGRMEFGPRALGARSILGDPRSPTMQKMLNLKVKYRESFRPFAPSVLRETVADWFELDDDSPYMLLVADVVEERRRRMTEEEQALFGIDKLNVPRSEIPAVTHVDYSARIQTVHADTNPRYHACSARSSSGPDARCSSTPASTCAASRSSAPRRTPSAASWAPRSRSWSSATAFSRRSARTPPSSRTTRTSSSSTESGASRTDTTRVQASHDAAPPPNRSLGDDRSDRSRAIVIGDVVSFSRESRRRHSPTSQRHISMPDMTPAAVTRLPSRTKRTPRATSALPISSSLSKKSWYVVTPST